MTINVVGLILCIIVSIALCIAQVLGNVVLIGMTLLAFLVLLGWESKKGNTLPVLLFFLPWSTIMKFSPGTVSFYTIGLMMVCGLALIQSKLRIGKAEMASGIILLLITFVSRAMEGTMVSMSYIAFMAMIFILPILKRNESNGKNNFYSAVIYFAFALVLTTFLAQWCVSYPGIKKYITVLSYSTLTRICGFNTDPNYYAAQVVAALSGTMLLMLRGDKKQVIIAGILSVLLIYSGLISVSKMFFVMFVTLLIMWTILLLRAQGKIGTKFVAFIVTMIALSFILSSDTFQQLFDTLINRFSNSTDIKSLTTGRSNIWGFYFKEIMSNFKIMLIGKGLTESTVQGFATHNVLIDFIFQLGLVGTIVLLFWIRKFVEPVSIKNIAKQHKLIDIGLLTIGIIGPWLSISILFFDEFFLFQWFLVSGMQASCDLLENENRKAVDTVNMDKFRSMRYE